jgi:hypothetical protein
MPMPTAQEIERRLRPEFTNGQATVLAAVISDAYSDLVKTGDFNELKEIVRDLAESQARTDVSMKAMAEAQARTDVSMKAMAEAQARTDVSMKALADAQARTEQVVANLAIGLDDLRGEVGGISRTIGYALENDAYRALPRFLEAQYGLKVTDRFIRTELAGEEINFLAHAVKADGAPVLVVGESKARLDERRNAQQSAQRVLDALQRKTAAAALANPGVEIVPLIVTHYARPAFLELAQQQGVIVIQSFELA